MKSDEIARGLLLEALNLHILAILINHRIFGGYIPYFVFSLKLG